MLRLLIAAAFAVVMTGCSREPSETSDTAEPATESTRELIFNTYLPAQDTMRSVSVNDFAARIERESGGTLKVTIPGSSLAPPDRQWGTVTAQVADMAMVPIYSQRAMLKLPLLADLPFAAISGEAASVALWKTQQAYFNSANEFKDVKLLSMHVLPGFNYISGVKPATRVDDFADLKVWASPGAASEALKTIDAIPVQTPFPQLFEYLSKGNVDAALIGAGTIKSASLADHVKYMTEVPGGLGSSSFAVIMSKDTWNGLSESQRAAVLKAADGLPARTGKALDERNENVLREIELEVNQLSAEQLAEMKARLASLKADWIESARQSGFSQAEAAFDYYFEQMQIAAGE